MQSNALEFPKRKIILPIPNQNSLFHPIPKKGKKTSEKSRKSMGKILIDS